MTRGCQTGGVRGKPRASLICLVIAVVSTLAGPGCALRRPQLTTHAAPIPEDGVLFVADGAGNYQCASTALREAVRAGGSPIQVVTFEWSHGYLRSVADLVDCAHARAQGRQLASLIREYRERHADKPVYIAGHSAGAMVVMAALEDLPPESVDGAVLISASLSHDYDVRRALPALKGCLHNFHSKRDWIYCGLFTRVLGTSDRRWSACSGRVGFRIMEGDEALWSKLRQRPWAPADAETGNDGGHFGNYSAAFLISHVLPVFRRGMILDPPRLGFSQEN